MRNLLSLLGAALCVSVASAKVVAAWDFSERRQPGSDVPGWTIVTATTIADGTGSTVNGVNVRLSGGLVASDANQIDSIVNFVTDGIPLANVSSTSSAHQRVYEDHFTEVHTGNPVYRISGLTPDQQYAIQFLGHFNAPEQLTVTMDGVPQASMPEAGDATAGDVLYSTRYLFTATSADTDVEFAFESVRAGNVQKFGLSGLVVGQVVEVPEPEPDQSPVITRMSIENAGASCRLSWTSRAGQMFEIQNSRDLINWIQIAEGVPASDTDQTTFDVDLEESAERRYYRVSLKTQQKPNVIMLFADDLGYGDLACYGHPYAKTDNLDRLASEGTLFRKFNVTGVTCNPSRTGLLTSRHPNSFPLKTSDFGFDQAQHGHEDRITIMKLLKEAGYRTGHFGKWHIGPTEADGTYGIDEVIVRGGGASDPRGRDEEIYADAIAFIEANKDVPFYMNVMGRVTHGPVDPRPELVTAAGFDGLVVDRDDFPGQQLQDIFDGVEANGGDIDVGMRNYLTEIYYLDQFIGELLAKLDQLGLAENTIVAFSSDQGAAVPRYDEDPVPAKQYNLVGWSGGLRGQKHDQYEGGIRSPFILRWPGRVPAGRVNQGSITSALDWLPTLCRIANVEIEANDFHGEDVLDIWLGADRSRIGPQFWNSSMKKDDWRLYFRGDDAVELYDLATDLAESNNLVNDRPDIVAELRPLWEEWRATLP